MYTAFKRSLFLPRARLVTTSSKAFSSGVAVTFRRTFTKMLPRSGHALPRVLAAVSVTAPAEGRALRAHGGVGRRALRLGGAAERAPGEGSGVGHGAKDREAT